jgi:hypothetical protein
MRIEFDVKINPGKISLYTEAANIILPAAE